MGMLRILHSLGAVSAALSKETTSVGFVPQPNKADAGERLFGRWSGKSQWERDKALCRSHWLWQLGRPGATVLWLCGNSQQPVAYEIDDVSAGDSRDSRNKWLGTGRRPWSKSEKASGEKMIRSACLSLMEILWSRRNKMLVQITCTHSQITCTKYAGLWNSL